MQQQAPDLPVIWGVNTIEWHVEDIRNIGMRQRTVTFQLKNVLDDMNKGVSARCLSKENHFGISFGLCLSTDKWD
jgi:hypothetical protein